MALRTHVAAAALLLIASAPTPAVADHPVPCYPAPDGEVTILLGLNLVAPHCASIASGERLTWVRASPTVPQDPSDTRAGGTCFSASRDVGHYLRLGESYTVEMTWDPDAQRVFVRAWDDDGEPVVWHDWDGNPITRKVCASNLHDVQPDGTVTVYWRSFNFEGIVHVTP